MYQKRLIELRKLHQKENLLVIGWWHSHLGIGLFLSSTDILTQKIHFPSEYQVALVIDPIQKEFKFFTYDNKSSKKYRSLSYAVIDSEEKSNE
jgi:proteasome lid subunit RPN8/RPN11